MAAALLPLAGAAAQDAGTDAFKAKARAASTEFESVFLNTMLAPAFEGLSTDGPFGGGEAEDTWRGLLIEQYAGEIAQSGGIGVADSIYRQLLSVQEGSQNGSI